MTSLRPTRAPVIAILVILAAALIAREFVRAQLINAGYAAPYAKDLSYLVVPAILAVLLWPILCRHGSHFRYIFRSDALTLNILVSGILIGLLSRIAWWSCLVAGISFGLVGDANSGAAIGPTFRFDCPAPAVVILGIVVTAGLTPFVEETIHRGLLISGLLRHGKLFAILVATLIFMFAHTTSAYAPAFLFGLILALQYVSTGAVWFSLATHASYNALIQLDWRCLNGQWNPAAEQLPLTGIGVAATATLLLSIGLIYRVLKAATTGTPRASRS